MVWWLVYSPIYCVGFTGCSRYWCGWVWRVQWHRSFGNLKIWLKGHHYAGPFPQLPSRQSTCGSTNSPCCTNDLCNAGSTCLQTGANKKWAAGFRINLFSCMISSRCRSFIIMSETVWYSRCRKCGLEGLPCCSGSCLQSTNKCALQGNDFRCVICGPAQIELHGKDSQTCKSWAIIRI